MTASGVGAVPRFPSWKRGWPQGSGGWSRGRRHIIVQAAVSAILVATLYLPGEMTEISRMVDALIGGATALAVVALFPERRPCY